MEPTNKQIAKLLKEAAAAYRVKDETSFRFQIIAYEKAADAIEHLTSEVKDLWEEEKLTSIPGVGPGIAQHLDELFKTAKVKHFENLKKGLPKGMFVLLNIPGMGAKTAYKLSKKFKLQNPETAIDEVEKIANSHKIAPIEGFGEKSEQVILENIQRYKELATKSFRMPLYFANEIAQKVVNYLKKSPFSLRVEPLGSLRRMVATIGDIDIAVATDNPKEVIDWFIKYPKAKRVLEKGEATASIIAETGAQVDLMVQPKESFGSLLQHFTGSKNHNIHLREYAQSCGLSLSEYGIKKKGKLLTFDTEEKFYQALGLQWIPPELREDSGEIEASLTKKLPRLVELNDIKGDLQIHSNYNVEPSHDLGEDSMKDVIKKAEKLSYQYLGFSEHNPSVYNHTERNFIDILKRRNEYIEQIKSSTKSVRIISLLEVDILVGGMLAVPDNALKLLDGCIISIHSAMEQSKDEMTQRVINGLQNPYARILAHPTGRIIQEREGFELDWKKIFAVCEKLDKAIEINAAPQRLDLPDTLVREAVKNKIKLIINTDAHAVPAMEMMPYGVAVARRGWAEPRDIINTLPYNEFINWLHKRS